MKNSKYDESRFFDKYAQMDRSQKGLSGAGEWETFREIFPELSGKRVLDLGCGYGWHCVYAAERGAKSVLGVDLSSRMLEEAEKRTHFSNVRYQKGDISCVEFPQESFDVVLSSLALHYIEDPERLFQKIWSWLSPQGEFLFSVEHPVFTAYGSQEWYRDENGKILHFPVDRYFEEGPRQAVFLGETVEKYHRTLTSYLEGLLRSGFELLHVKEPKPPESMMNIPGMKDELRRPMMLLAAARKKPRPAKQ